MVAATLEQTILSYEKSMVLMPLGWQDFWVRARGGVFILCMYRCFMRHKSHSGDALSS